MKYVVKHGLADRAKVRGVVEKAYEAYKTRLADHQPSLRWKGADRGEIEFTVLRKTLTVDVAIDDRELRLEADMPFLFRPFQGKIERVLGEEVQKWLTKARAGEV
jgi:hypothetical protein